MVQATERFLIEARAATKTAQLLGSWAALAWMCGEASDGPEEAPATREPARPTRSRAQVELRLASGLAEGLAYPDKEWWAEVDEVVPGVSGRCTEPWWNLRLEEAQTRELFYGTMISLLWMLSPGHVTPKMFAPFVWSDGTAIDPRRRTMAGEDLARMWAECRTGLE